MIVTRTMLEHMGACIEAVEWCEANNAYDTTPEQFRQILWDAGQAPWYLWARDMLDTAPAIMQQASWEYFGPYRVIVDDVATEYADFSSADAARQQAMEEFHARFAYMFSVNAVNEPSPGTKSTTPCSIDLEFDTPAGTTYEAFDHSTGVYVSFATFDEARSFALAKREARELECRDCYFVERQVREVGGTVSAWAIVTS